MRKELNNLYSYRDGKLYWKNPIRNSTLKGKGAGHLRSDGRRDIRFKGKLLRESRAIYIMFNGEIDKGLVVDHINRDPLDNRIENLRLLTHSQNSLNSKRKGYFWNGCRYRARIYIQGKNIELGTFKTEEEASSAYEEAKSSLKDGSFDRLYWQDPNSKELKYE